MTDNRFKRTRGVMDNRKRDVIVIGAGVIGLASAYELRKRGAEVTIVEEKEPGWAASHGNAGMVYPAAGEPATRSVLPTGRNRPQPAI